MSEDKSQAAKNLASLASLDELITTTSNDCNDNDKFKDDYNKAHQDKMDELYRENYSNDIKLRKDFAHKFFWLTVVYLIALFIILFETGILHIYNVNFLDNSVLITLLTTTTINILALIYAVAHYLFPNANNSIAKSN